MVQEVAADPDQLLSLALADPARALAEARIVLAGRPGPALASAAHQTAGVVLRHYGAIDESIRELRAAVRWARRAGDMPRATDVASSLGVALVLAGRSRAGVAMLDRAVDESQGVSRGRILIRLAHIHWLLGDYQPGLTDAKAAVRLLRNDETVWQARSFNHRAMLHLALGAVASADRDYARSEELFAACGHRAELAYARMERGLAAHALGDLPRALNLLDQARAEFDALDVVEPDLAAARAGVLLAAGLTRDALEAAQHALSDLARMEGSPSSIALLSRWAARAALADGDLDTAVGHAQEALAYYRRQRHQQAADQSQLVLLQACAAGADTGMAPATLLRRTVRLARRLERTDPTLASPAHLLAGQIALTAGRRRQALAELEAAAPPRRAPTRSQVSGWLARALRAEATGDSRALLRSCASGLRLLDTHLRTLGATELRSAATAEGAELATVALRHVVGRGDPRSVLTWSERWRAVTLTAPPLRPMEDSELNADLAALRVVTRRLADADSPRLRRERRRLEEQVRSRVLGQSAQRGEDAALADGPRIIGELARSERPLELVELTSVDGELFAVHVRAGSARLHHIGSLARARTELDHMLFLLRREGLRASRFRSDDDAVGTRLQQALLGEVAERLREPEVVIAPTGSLHAVPWSVMPSLRERAVVVTPSASAWLRARGATPRPRGRVVLVGGPGLDGGSAEIAALERLYSDAVVLTGAAATVRAVTKAMDGARLVHIAAHGTFRADSPLFSTIELADGPLTGYDLEQLPRAPHQVVLSSCSSAVSAPTGADELLGLVGALIARGCAGVVASVVHVSDRDTVPLMLTLHRHLEAGSSLAQALASARLDVVAAAQPLEGLMPGAASDAAIRLSRRTAEAFVALGA